VRTATVVRSLDATIDADFGNSHGPLIKLFLDNRPLGCAVEPEMEPYVYVRQPDRVLRLDTERFATHMRPILNQVVSNETIIAPFKKNWIAQMRDRKTLGA